MPELKTRLELQAENDQLKRLLTWVGPRIQRRNGNGTVSGEFCLLCVLGQPQYRHPCRHAEIWQIMREVLPEDAHT